MPNSHLFCVWVSFEDSQFNISKEHTNLYVQDFGKSFKSHFFASTGRFSENRDDIETQIWYAPLKCNPPKNTVK